MQHHEHDFTQYRLLTAEQVARRWQIPTSTVYEYARRKHDPLPHRRIGKHMRFVLAEIDAWADDQRGQAA